MQKLCHILLSTSRIHHRARQLDYDKSFFEKQCNCFVLGSLGGTQGSWQDGMGLYVLSLSHITISPIDSPKGSPK